MLTYNWHVSGLRRAVLLSLTMALPLTAVDGCLVEVKDLRPNAGGGSASGEVGGSSACPADMIPIHHTESSFCIDRTEVTRSHYVAFLQAVDSSVANVDQPSDECHENLSLTPAGSGQCPEDFNGEPDVPVSCVDWCDAYAYCAWAEKRLCGSISDGAALSFNNRVDGEWNFACTAGLTQDFPYGDDYMECACNSSQNGCGANRAAIAPVGTFPDCEGGFDGIFDMLGNAGEWINSCNSEDNCLVRGGGPRSNTQSGCTFDNNMTARQHLDRDIGFRCCADPDGS